MSLVDLMEVHGEVGQHAWPLDPRLPLPEGVPAPAPAPWAWFWGVAKLCLVLAVAASLSFNYSEVRGASMMPGIHDRDRILVDHVSLAFTEIEHGDVVVLRYPLDPRMDYIKRVVGLPGDEIVVQFGGVWVNGKPVEEPYVSVSALDPYTSVHTVVKPGHYFVLGDNRIRSSDSREFGQVPQELIRGLVRLRVWPLDRIGWIH
ncbi:MAG: signal peptidase I [Planctomycetota bacterium]